MTRTKKPCPLCKEPGLRDADDVCVGCRRKHERLLKLEAELAEREDLQAYKIPVKDWPFRAPFQFHVSPDLGKALSNMLLTIAPLTSVQYPGSGSSSRYIPYFQNSYTSMEARLLTPQAEKYIREFFDLMQSEFERCASFSIQQGKNLLCQFASGGVTADELNQAGIKDGRL